MYWRILLIISSAVLASCSIVNSITEDDPKGPKYGKTLADLGEISVPEKLEPAPVTTIDQIEETYHAALSVAKDADVRHRILARLADLEMVRAEQNQLNATEQKEFFNTAINMFSELLVLNTERQNEEGTPSNERLLYQLSKAYALDGRMAESDEILTDLVTTFPQSPFAAEADFRRAEKAFSDENYDVAEQLYARVMQAGELTPFYINSVYMHGWSQFKRNRYRASIRSFTEVLDKSLIEGRAASQLTNTQRNMSKDTLRVLSIAFSYLEGAESITDVYNTLGVRHYKHLLYMELGDLYFEKRRFRDSADTYRHYVQQFPNTDQAPEFSTKAIETYDKGGFPSLILPAKEEYVRSYGAYSTFWAERDDSRREAIKPKLSLYLDELSSYYHARAIALDKLNSKYQKKVARGKKVKSDEKPEPAKPEYLKAAAFYEEFVFTFPEDKRKSEMAYLMGESFYAAGELERAVTAYETVAYNYLDKKRGAEAGFSAVIALQELMDENSNDPALQQQYLRWRDHKIESAISFSDYYPGDKRAVELLTSAAQAIFEKNEFQRAADVALRITQWQPVPNKKLLKSGWLIVAHSRFDLQQFEAAEVGYRRLLEMLAKKDLDRPQIIERLAAAIYKQAETQIAANELAPAVQRLLSIREIAPNSDIAISAQYDAANHLITLKDWANAEKILLDFKKNFSAHKLAATLAPKFAFIYQESQQWAKAAGALAEMSASATTEEERRQALYLSAELYEKAGKENDALERYKQYANKYPQPFDIATEARFHLVELYGKTRQESKRNYWLKKLIDEDANAGASRTQRSKYLAAFATIKFANDEFYRYERIKLKLPLKKSLKKKKAALDVTMDAFKKVLNYGIAEFATQANHRIGNIYMQLSADLMDSQRPRGLDDLALEQYEILLEEQALPFEEKAIDILASNAERSWVGIYDDWVKQSFKTLAKILPARYGKQEHSLKFNDEIY
ncbi:MAG: tetratricopeptide repeat protein [Agarilytica sp.]